MAVVFKGKRVQELLKGVVERSNDLKKPLAVIAMEMKKSVQENIDNERSYKGAKWKKSKRAIRENGTTLKDTGRLYNSFTTSSGRDFAKTGTNVIYARRLNYGDKAKGLSSYEYLGFTDDMKKRYVNIIQNYIINNKIK